MSTNRRPLYQSHETIVLERPRRRRAPLLVGAVTAITLAGALIGNGLRPAAAPQTPQATAVAPSRGAPGSLAPTAQASAPAAPAPAAASAPTTAPAPGAAPTAGERFVVRGVSNGLFVRARPSTEQPAIGAVAQGDVVVATGAPVSAGGRAWLPISAGSLEGWVAVEYLEAAP